MKNCYENSREGPGGTPLKSEENAKKNLYLGVPWCLCALVAKVFFVFCVFRVFRGQL
jgi:hypothetical protein